MYLLSIAIASKKVELCVEIKALLFLRCSCTTWRLAIKRAGLTLSEILWRLEGHGRRDARVKTAPEWSTVHCTRRREPGTSESSPRPIVELTTHCSALSLQLKPRALLLLLPPVVCIVLSVINHWRGNSATSPWLSLSSCCFAGRSHLRSGTFRLYLPSLRSSLALFPSSPKCLYLGRLKYLDLQYVGRIGAHLICKQTNNEEEVPKRYGRSNAFLETVKSVIAMHWRTYELTD